MKITNTFKKLIIFTLAAMMIIGVVFGSTACSNNSSKDDQTSDEQNNQTSQENKPNTDGNQENQGNGNSSNTGDDSSTEQQGDKEDQNTEDSTKPNENKPSENKPNENQQGSDNTQEKPQKPDSGSENVPNKDPENNQQNNQGSSQGNTDQKPSGDMEINKENIYAIDGHYFKSIAPLNEKSVLKAAKYINTIKETYLTDKNKVFYSVIPDKTFYDKSGKYDVLDYNKMVDLMNANVTAGTFIKISDLLSLDDFYLADNHWRQEKIIDVAQRIGQSMGFSVNAADFKTNTSQNFSGLYSKYLPAGAKKEDIKYLTNAATENAVVDNYQNKAFKKVYDSAKLSTDISYDVFLSGATPFITITNSSAQTERELVIFRDSYASSIAPLLISQYSKITLIDNRYLASFLMKDFITFDSQDILFLYSSAMVNNSAMLK